MEGRQRARGILGIAIEAMIVVALLLTAAAQADIAALPTAINTAGKQRMLTQRMVKAYCMIGIEVQKGEARLQLDDSIALFDQQLAALEKLAVGPEVTQSLKRVKVLWSPFKSALQLPVSKERATLLMKHNDELLRATNDVVELLEGMSEKDANRLVNLSGRQRMLSQRLAKLYMARAWGIDDPGLAVQMELGADEFTSALRTLSRSAKGTEDLRNALEDAKAQWQLLHHALNQGTGDMPLIVAIASEQILDTMNSITGMYESLAMN